MALQKLLWAYEQELDFIDLNKSFPKSFGKSASLSHNYATKSPLVTIQPQNCLFSFDDHHSNLHEYTNPSTIPNGIRIQSAVLPQYTFQTDRQTDTHTV